MITIRELRKDEWERARPVFAQFDEALPHAMSSVIVVAEDDVSGIVGLIAGRLIFHTEPLWVLEGFESGFIIPKMIKQLRELLPDASYAIATTTKSKIKRLLVRLGFVKQPYDTFLWRANG
jgi:hypothetical protein